MKNIFSKSTITSLVVVGLSLMPSLRVSATNLSTMAQSQQSITEMTTDLTSSETSPVAQRVRHSLDSNLKVASSDPFSLDWICKTPEGRRHPWAEHVICPN